MSRSLSTAVNGSAGANSQVSGLVVAAMTVVTLLLLTGLFEKLPEATLAAVVIAAVIELVDFGSIARLYRVSTRRLRQGYGVAGRPDFIGAIAALLGVTVFDTLPGLFIGIAISMILLLYRASRPRIAELLKVPGTPDRYADAERLTGGERRPGVVILRVESGLFFANADWVRDHVRSATRRPGTTALVLDASNIAFIDVTAVEMLDQLADTLQYEGVALRVARDIGTVRDLLGAAGASAGPRRVFATVQDAVDAVDAVGAARSGPDDDAATESGNFTQAG